MRRYGQASKATPNQQTRGLPYYEIVLEALERGDPRVEQALGRHLHFGYWDVPRPDRVSTEGFRQATERLCHKVFESAKICDGQRILDVGCGIGGTLATIDHWFERMDLVGLNSDPLQLERARNLFGPSSTNGLVFVTGDACDLRFQDQTFDLVLALECIFHFSDREAFFRGVRRVLRPGGRLVLTDFCPVAWAAPFVPLGKRLLDPRGELHGPVDMSWTLQRYRSLGQKTGLPISEARDITYNTLPSYRFFRHLVRAHYRRPSERLSLASANRLMEVLSRNGMYRYLVLSFRKH